MLRGIRSRITYANVVASMALFIALGGVGYASVKLKKNSVGSAQIKRNAVSGIKVKDGSLSSKDIGGSLSSEAWHELDPPSTPGGEPDFMNDWESEGLGYSTAAFYRDRLGIVHLRGIIRFGTADAVFVLPAGYRPELDGVFAAASDNNAGLATAQIYVRGPSSNSGAPDGTVEAKTSPTFTFIALDGVAFRCAPSGSNGCP